MFQAPLNGPVVFIVDSVNSSRDALAWTVQAAGYSVAAFNRGETFLQDLAMRSPSAVKRCIVSDIVLDDMDGFELQERLSQFDDAPPLLFLSGRGDIPMAVRAIKQGAFNFLERPMASNEMLEQIGAALKHDRIQQRNRAKFARIRNRLDRLSSRERDVLRLIIMGHTSHAIGVSLNISHRTVENHRIQILRKMRTSNSIELVRIVMSLTAGNAAWIEAQIAFQTKPRGARSKSQLAGQREPAEKFLSDLLS